MTCVHQKRIDVDSFEVDMIWRLRNVYALTSIGCNRTRLFIGCVRWMRGHTPLRKVLGRTNAPIVYLIKPE